MKLISMNILMKENYIFPYYYPYLYTLIRNSLFNYSVIYISMCFISTIWKMNDQVINKIYKYDFYFLFKNYYFNNMMIIKYITQWYTEFLLPSTNIFKTKEMHNPQNKKENFHYLIIKRRHNKNQSSWIRVCFN